MTIPYNTTSTTASSSTNLPQPSAPTVDLLSDDLYATYYNSNIGSGSSYAATGTNHPTSPTVTTTTTPTVASNYNSSNYLNNSNSKNSSNVVVIPSNNVLIEPSYYASHQGVNNNSSHAATVNPTTIVAPTTTTPSSSTSHYESNNSYNNSTTGTTNNYWESQQQQQQQSSNYYNSNDATLYDHYDEQYGTDAPTSDQQERYYNGRLVKAKNAHLPDSVLAFKERRKVRTIAASCTGGAVGLVVLGPLGAVVGATTAYAAAKTVGKIREKKLTQHAMLQQSYQSSSLRDAAAAAYDVGYDTTNSRIPSSTTTNDMIVSSSSTTLPQYGQYHHHHHSTIGHREVPIERGEIS